MAGEFNERARRALLQDDPFVRFRRSVRRCTVKDAGVRVRPRLVADVIAANVINGTRGTLSVCTAPSRAVYVVIDQHPVSGTARTRFRLYV